MEEIWKDIAGYEGRYQISNLGRVKSLERRCRAKHYTRRVPEKIYSPAVDAYGYFIVSLHLDGKKKTRTIHRLVAETFIPNPENLKEVNHKDENKQNNAVWNLEWCSTQYNSAYGTRVDRIKKTQSTPIIQCDMNGNEIREWFGMGEVSRQTGFDQGLISRVCNGKGKSAYGYKWKFKQL